MVSPTSQNSKPVVLQNMHLPIPTFPEPTFQSNMLLRRILVNMVATQRHAVDKHLQSSLQDSSYKVLEWNHLLQYNPLQYIRLKLIALKKKSKQVWIPYSIDSKQAPKILRNPHHAVHQTSIYGLNYPTVAVSKLLLVMINQLTKPCISKEASPLQKIMQPENVVQIF